ncbi:hypothetical protein [uncultured Fibrella sp.]|uniref:hypothetical protein n=1 Tax=uncultured Fibrella sp. TaxID=1284596 RepID=UPI0035C9E645
MLFFFSTLLLLVGAEMMVIRSTAFTRAPTLFSLAVLFDLCGITSVLFYGFLASPNGWSPMRTVVVVLLMVRVGLLLLPTNTLPAFLNGPFLFALAEAGALAIAVVRIRIIRLTYLKLRPTTTADKALLESFAVVFGQRTASIILGEWQIISYAIGGWWLRADVPADATALTTHRDSGQIALTVALGAVCLIELVSMHLLVARWNHDVAFWLTMAGAYSLLLLVADVVATLKRPSYLTANAFHLRLGIRWLAVISRDQIGQIERIDEKPVRRDGVLNVALLTGPNVLLTLSEPVMVQGPYGIRREATQLALWIDGGTAALS